MSTATKTDHLMISIENSLVLVIDVQGNLVPRMDRSSDLIVGIGQCIQIARILNIPIIYTEQVPAKLGRTLPEIKALFPQTPPIEKSTFSCWTNDVFVKQFKKFDRQHIIVVGIETHVCVFQTVRDLLNEDYNVQVVAEAVSSRTRDNKMIALERMRGLGATITSGEMFATELIRGAEHEKFKDILSLIK